MKISHEKLQFNIFAQNIDRGYTLEPPRGGDCDEYPQPMLLIKKNNKKNMIKFHGHVS